MPALYVYLLFIVIMIFIIVISLSYLFFSAYKKGGLSKGKMRNYIIAISTIGFLLSIATISLILLI